MKKLKILLSVVSVLLVMLLSSCVESKPHEHDFQMKSDNLYHYLECECGEKKGETYHHTYEWINGEDPTLASLECAECDWVYDYEKEFNKPVLVVPRGGGGGEPAMAPIMSYQISTEKGIYNIGEEFEITLSLNLNDSNLLDGPFHVKLAKSPYYEIVGDDEYVIEDFCISDYRGKKDSIVDFKFKVRAIASSELPRPFEFKIKCNAKHEELEYYRTNYIDVEGYYDSSEEYFITICDLRFIMNSGNILLSQKPFDLFFASINNKYASCEISKDEYIRKCTEYLYFGSAAIKRYDSNRYSYYSKNIRAFFTLSDEYSYLDEYFNSNKPTDSSFDPYLEGYSITANVLLDILLEKDLISDAEYENEKKYINESGVTTAQYSRTIPDYIIPFYDYYTNRAEEMTIQCVESTVLEQNSNGRNSASLYLSECKIPVGSEINLTVYTDFSQSIESLSVIDRSGGKRQPADYRRTLCHIA